MMIVKYMAVARGKLSYTNYMSPQVFYAKNVVLQNPSALPGRKWKIIVFYAKRILLLIKISVIFKIQRTEK